VPLLSVKAEEQALADRARNDKASVEIVRLTVISHCYLLATQWIPVSIFFPYGAMLTTHLHMTAVSFRPSELRRSVRTDPKLHAFHNSTLDPDDWSSSL
jgi:hypothetical protein